MIFVMPHGCIKFSQIPRDIKKHQTKHNLGELLLMNILLGHDIWKKDIGFGHVPVEFDMNMWS